MRGGVDRGLNFVIFKQGVVLLFRAHGTEGQ